MEIENTPKWHRKWLVLLGFLTWLFLYRYRVMGWVFSKLLTYQLSKSQSTAFQPTRISVRIERISLQPLRFYNVQVCGTGLSTWRLVLSKVEVQSHVKEFFESFGLVKFCILAIDQMEAHVDEIDPVFLQELVIPTTKPTTNEAPNPRSATKLNPICYMRFVDLQVQTMHLCVHSLDLTTQLHGTKLYVGITDVYVQRSMLQLQVQVQAMIIESWFQSHNQLKSNDHSPDGLRIQLPATQFILDVKIKKQRFCGWKIVGQDDEKTTVVVQTAFLERLLMVRNEIIGKRVDGNTREKPSTCEKIIELSPVPFNPFKIELVDCSISMTFVQHVETLGSIPLEISTDIRKFLYHRQLKEVVANESATNENVTVQIEAWLEHFIMSNLATNDHLLTVSCLEIQTTQSTSNRGAIGTARCKNIDVVLNQRTEKLVHSFVQVHERMKTYQLEAKRMKNAIVSTPEFVHPRHLSWELALEMTAWTFAFQTSTQHDPINVFRACGATTSVQMPLFSNTTDASWIKRCIVVEQIGIDVLPPGHPSHFLVLKGVNFTLSTSFNALTSVKSTQFDITFAYISVNGLEPETSDENHGFPALYLEHVECKHEKKLTNETIDVKMDLEIRKTIVKCEYWDQKAFLVEWGGLKSLLQHLELLASSLSPNTTLPEPATRQNGVKNMEINALLRETTVRIRKIPHVTAVAAFTLADANVTHRIAPFSTSTSCSWATATLSWNTQTSFLEVSHGVFETRKSVGRQRYLTKVPLQSDFRCTVFKLHLCPESHLLLLFLRLHELLRTSSDSDKQSSAQGISIAWGLVILELEDQKNSIEKVARVHVTTFGLKLTRSSPRHVTEAVVRVAQSMGKEGLRDWSFTEVAHDLIVMEGTASASTLSLALASRKLVDLQDTELRFALTKVEWSRLVPWNQVDPSSECVPRTLCFDLSLLTEHVHLRVEKTPLDTLMQLLQILPQALDTTQEPKQDQDHKTTPIILPQKTPFHLRYAGNVDLACHHVELTSSYNHPDALESKRTRVELDALVLSLGHFQVLGFKCSPLRVLLEDTPTGMDPHPESFQLLYVPEISAKTLIHWQPNVHELGQLHYCFSLELFMGKTQSSDPSTRVPCPEELLIALNWDRVYPWLVFMLTDDDPKPSSPRTEEIKRFQCIGMQYELAISLLQLVWWDTATQEIGRLVIATDLSSHGIVRRLASSWKLWETSIFLQLCRGYLLHPDTSVNEATVPSVLPFQTEMSSNFALETMGTSYRKTFAIEDHDDDDDIDALNEDFTALFASSSSLNLVPKLHETFVPLEYDFGLPFPPETTRQWPPMLQKAPRSVKHWTQSMNTRQWRLQPQSLSMENVRLKDGSCPIQVDSMKLLWTIQTRDSVFYMAAVTLESLRKLLDTRRQEDKTSAVPSPVESRRDKKKKKTSIRSPSIVLSDRTHAVQDTAAAAAPVLEPLFVWQRRQSTRDTLLELLQQGKLGDESSSSSQDETPRFPYPSKSDDETSETDVLQLVIALKAYTVDIHDAQITVRDDTTRSNMLLASKHIHFELGTDASQDNTIATLTFDNVTAHVAPIDVDISAGVLWYAHSPTASASALLQQIMDECSLTSSYTQRQKTGATSTQVDLSFLQLSTDRHQFYQLMNVIRHVLLAPPSMARRPKRTQYTPKDEKTSSQGETTDFPPAATSLTASTSAKKLHMLLEDELRNREIRTRGTASRSKAAMTALKAISFQVVGLQWRLRLSPETAGSDQEFSAIRIHGFTGCHTYFTNHCTKLTLHLQWLEVTNLTPGPSSAAFDDPTAVLKATIVVDKRVEASAKVPLGNQKGMLLVRAESGPIVRLHGQKLRVLDVLEVSLFPEMAYMIVMQLAADFYDLVYKFFFEKMTSVATPEHHSEQLFLGRKLSTYGPPVSPTTSFSNVATSQKPSSSPFGKPRGTSAASLPPSSSLLMLRKTSSSTGSESSGSVTAVNGLQTSSTADDLSEENDAMASDDCELFYVKYVRVGNVRLRINCNGFFVNLSHFDLDLPPYICQSKLCTSKQLLQKFESHLKWVITKESASSGLSQFKNKLLKWTPSSSSASSNSVTDGKKEKGKKQDENTAAANAQVLFGPYSKIP